MYTALGISSLAFAGVLLAWVLAARGIAGKINRVAGQMTDGAEQVSAAAEQVASASQSLAQGASEQAAAVEETSSSLEQMSSMTKQNAANAAKAKELADQAYGSSRKGAEAMVTMSAAINDIQKSANDTAEIVKTIDDIAFQTNLLALNAAVEAARAGQHGRGFAVVAQEVRNLAGRSAKAARETAEMIEDSIKRVGEGVEIAKDTSEALNQMVTNVVKVKDLVAEIATASAEQSRGVSQANTTMEQVAKGAQDGSQQAQELASASTELTSLAEHMREEVRRFKLRERQVSAFGGGIPGLEGLTPDMIAQLRAMLTSQGKPSIAKAGGGNGGGNGTANGVKRGSPKVVLPLDRDERGFGKF
jgi:methyl-accepting chemotaxis protein